MGTQEAPELASSYRLTKSKGHWEQFHLREIPKRASDSCTLGEQANTQMEEVGEAEEQSPYQPQPTVRRELPIPSFSQRRDGFGPNI